MKRKANKKTSACKKFDKVVFLVEFPSSIWRYSQRPIWSNDQDISQTRGSGLVPAKSLISILAFFDLADWVRNSIRVGLKFWFGFPNNK